MILPFLLLLLTFSVSKQWFIWCQPHCPDKVEINRGGNLFHEGDRIIQLTNDYNREVFNGDLGIIQNIDTVEQEVAVQYGERTVVYDYADLNEIALAWSVTIHKSQGSEYPVVVLPIYMMLTRNLFYTLFNSCQEVSDRGWSKKSDIFSGALY